MFHIFFTHGGPIMWLLFLLGAGGSVIFLERLLHYHRAQINTKEFLTGVKNVLRRDNVVEAVAICDATPGPVARLVKTAIINSEQEPQSVNDVLETAGLAEIPRLEARLSWLAIIAEISQPLGCLGTVLALIKVFRIMEENGPFTHIGMLSGGVWEALIATALGLTLSIVARVGYNYLIDRVNTITLDMEKTATDIISFLLAERQ